MEDDVREVFMRKIDQYDKAVSRLEEAIASDVDPKFKLDVVIHRFMFCYELCWKLLKWKLNEQGLEANTPKVVFREAFAAGYLDRPYDWNKIVLDRNLITHTYSEENAFEIYDRIVGDYLALFKAVSSKMKEQLFS